MNKMYLLSVTMLFLVVNCKQSTSENIQTSTPQEITHEQKEEHELNAERDQIGDKDGHRHGEAGEIHLSEEVGVGDECIRGLGQAAGKVGPDHGPWHVEQELGQAVGGELGHPAKDDGKGDGG